jgi:hypothetical protein
VAALITTRRLLGLDREKWERVGEGSLTSAAALVVVASFLLALNRFGGLVIDEPRSFVRLVLVGVWGWIGMAVVATAVLVVSGSARGGSGRTLRATLAVIGAAHVPLIWASVMLFLGAGMLQLLWPGLIMVVLVFAFWFPAAVGIGLRVSCGARVGVAVAATAVSYAAWVTVVGRHLYDQLAHLV